MIRQRLPSIAIWVIIAIAFASLVNLSYRYKVEARNKRVGLCLEMQAVKDASAATQMPIAEVLAKLKGAGATHIAISEDHLEDLLKTSDASLENGVLSAKPGETYKRVRFGIEDRFKLKPPTNDRSKGIWGPINVPMSTLLTCSIGIDPEDAKAVRDSGLEVVARIGNAPAIDEQYVGQKLTDAKEAGASFYLPEGDAVLGQRFLVKDAASALESADMLYAAPEFVKLAGDNLMASKSLTRLVRLHSIQSAEIDRMSPGEALERWVRAFSERNIRLLLLRPLSSAAKPSDPKNQKDSETAVDTLLGVVKSVKDGVVSQGGGIGVPRPFDDPRVPEPLFALIGIGVAILISLLASEFVRSSGWQAVIGVLLILGGGACYVPSARPYMALLAAMAFPIAAYVYLGGVTKIVPLRDYLVMSLISLTGGLAVAALLNTLPYFVRVEQFTGVKLAHFGPIVIVALILISWTSSVRELLAEPVRWLPLIVALLALAAIGLMFLRTGNDNPAAVSGLELRFRALLDAVLFVRPRTKEFLLGNPALLLGLLFWADALRRGNPISADLPKSPPPTLAAVLLVVGAIGQTSIVNTLCHLHTPLQLSFMRIAMGLLAGGIFGGILWLLFRPRILRQVPANA